MSKQDEVKSDKEPEEIQEVVVEIRGKKYVLPSNLEYEQYYKASKLIDESDIDFTQFIGFEKQKNNLQVGMEIMKFLNSMVKANILPEFFSIILVPQKEDGTHSYWEENEAKGYIPDMRKLTDVDMMDIAQSFFVGRGILMSGGFSALQGFKGLKKN